MKALREILDRENKLGVKRMHDIDWRLSMVTATRQKQKIMCPKYTMKLQMSETTLQEPVHSEQVMDLDYTTMKRLQMELLEAIKSVEGPYPRKVQKFIK